MNTAIVIAVVALAGSVVTAIVSTFGLPLDDGGRRRLTKVQHLLLELVRELDDKGRQYPFTMNEA